MDPTAANPQPPSWIPTGGDEFEQLHPSELQRFREMRDVLDDEETYWVSIGYKAHGREVVRGFFGKYDSLQNRRRGSDGKPGIPNPRFDPSKPPSKTNRERLTYGLKLYQPPGMPDPTFNTMRFGIQVQDVNHLEKLLIGEVPNDLIRMAAFGVKNGVNVFQPEFRFTDRYATLEPGEQRQLDPREPRRPGQNIVNQGQLMERARAGWRQHVVSTLQRMATKPALAGTPSSNVTFPDFRSPTAQGPQPGEMPISVAAALSMYEKYMTEEMEPVLSYAQNIAYTSIANGKEASLNEAMAAAAAAKKTGIPLDKDLTSIVGPVEGREQAVALHFAGKPTVEAGVKKPGLMFLDLSTTDDFFKNKQNGAITDPARAIFERAETMRKDSRWHLEHRKVVMLSEEQIHEEPMGRAPKKLDYMKYVGIRKPDNKEVEELIIPERLREKFAGQRAWKAVQDGKPVNLYAPDGQETPELMRLSKEMARYASGFTHRGLDFYMSDIFHKMASMASKEGEIAYGKTVDLKRLLSTMRDSYIEKLFASYGTAEGAAVKDQFTVVDVDSIKPGEMSHPQKIEDYIRNIKKTEGLGRVLGDEESYDIQKLKNLIEVLKNRGIDLDPLGDFGFFPSRYKKGPDGKDMVGPDGKKIPLSTKIKPESSVWDELKDSDVPKIREALKRSVKQSAGNFMLLHGPGGTGKTSTAAYLADVLGYGFLEWKPCLAKNKLVGETGRLAELGYDFVLGLTEYVILLDEIDGCLGKISSEQTHPSDNDIRDTFKRRWNEIQRAAPKQNLFFVSATNYLERIPEPVQRRLGGENIVEVKYLKELPELQKMADIVINRNSDKPGFEYFSQLKNAFADALFREAGNDDKGAYSNYEIGLLFNAFLTFNQKVIKELGPEMAYDEGVLRAIVQRSKRQSTSGSFEPAFPSIEELKQGTLGQEKLPGAPGSFSTPGFVPVEDAPPSGQPTPKLPPGMKPGPKARDVNLPAEEQGAEDYLVTEAPPPPQPRRWQRKPTAEALPRSVKMAALETSKRPTIKLMAIADNAIDQAHGLKYVKDLPEFAGMLFKFQSPKVLSFWMQDTYLALDIAFIDNQGFIVKTERMIPLSTRSVTSGRPCVMALEVPAGSLEKIGAKVGKKVNIDLENNTVSIDD